MLLLPNNSLVLRAFSTLANAAPGKTNYDYHLSYVKDFGSAGYVSALNQIFANVSDTDLATLTLNNLGLNSIFSVDTAKAFIAGNAANRVGAVLNLADAVANYAGTDAALLAAKTAYNNKLDYSFNYSTVATNLLPSNFPDSIDLTTFNLTTAIDNLVGSSGNDFFKAYLSGNSNTLNSGDIIKGGLGFDTLYADLTNPNGAITAETTGVEYVQLRAEHKSTDSTDNNTSITSEVQIDAQRMQGVTTWENNNSRADLLIEDVRIAANQITKDITIAMVETDPGHVDFGVYFDQLSLRNQTATTSVLSLELLDTRSKAAGTGPLKDNPYNGFGFLLNGQAVVVQSAAIDNALTYADLRAAIETRINELKATNPALANFTVTLGADFNRYDTESGQLVTGTKILLTDTAGGVITLNPAVGWVTATGTVPPSSGLHTNISNAATTSTDLVTSKVILDDVGRGSTGGDLVIGGLSVGDTSTSKGVQRFEIEVRDNSKLQTINSTNNTLQEVTIKNGATSSNSTAYTTTVKDSGNLTVNGKVDNLDGGASSSDQNVALPGAEAQHNAFGFSDVRLIDGSAMTGKLEFTAEITAASKAKYLNLVDVAANAPAVDNVAFVYSGGSANDTMKVTIDGATMGSTGTLGAREDFTFTLNGGAGDDKLTVSLDKNGATAAWYVDQAALDNVTINGGDGNDTINKPGSGDVIINAGSGNDTVYTDNSALDNGVSGHATWVVSSTAANGGAVALLDDLQGVPANNTDIFLYKGKLTVTFSGDSSADKSGGVTGLVAGVAAAGTNGWEVTVDIPTGSNYAVNQMYLNQAIKLAINSDPVLSKLLLAQDGPLNTLTVKSLIDGTFLDDDLLLSVSGVDVTTLSATEQTSVLTAYKAFAHNSAATIAVAQAAQAATVIDLNNNEGMSTGQVLITNGDQSTAATDNFIDLGTGNDVLVLSSSALANETLVFKGYDLGKDTVVNFENGANVAGSIDKLDFTSYLTNKESLSGSTESQTRIATSLNGDAVVEANSVTVLAAGLDFNDTTAKFSELTAAKLLAAINSTNTGSADYAGITAASLNALNTYVSSGAPTTLVGGIGKAVVLVENDDNKGEYAAFELTFNGLATNATADFTAATLIGTVDFGTSAGLTLANLV